MCFIGKFMIWLYKKANHVIKTLTRLRFEIHFKFVKKVSVMLFALYFIADGYILQSTYSHLKTFV